MPQFSEGHFRPSARRFAPMTATVPTASRGLAGTNGRRGEQLMKRVLSRSAHLRCL